MIEVEAKIRILNPDEIRKKIRAIAKFSEKIKKADTYYTMEDLKGFPKKSLRVRKVNSHYKINFKSKLSYLKGVHAKKEVEFSVSDIENFFELIKEFGFRKWLVKEKVSEIYKLKENFHVELNNVKNLGWFLEIEYLVKQNEVKKARAEVLSIMKKLGVKRHQIIKQGYTKMLWDKEFVVKRNLLRNS